MSDVATLKQSTVDANAGPGQTFLDLHGDGGDEGTQSEDGRELAQDREQWEHWFVVSRPPANATHGDTEYLVARLGGDDVVGCESRNIGIAKAVNDELARDLDEGEVVLFTGDGSGKHAMIDVRPNGDLVISNADGANSISATWDASTGHCDIVTSGKFRIGGAGATSAIARESDLDTLYTTAVVGIKSAFDSHVHTCAAVGAPSSTPMLPPAVPLVFPAWPATVASASGECD